MDNSGCKTFVHFNSLFNFLFYFLFNSQNIQLSTFNSQLLLVFLSYVFGVYIWLIVFKTDTVACATVVV